MINLLNLFNFNLRGNCGGRNSNTLKSLETYFRRKSYRYYVSITEAASGSSSFRMDTISGGAA